MYDSTLKSIFHLVLCLSNLICQVPLPPHPPGCTICPLRPSEVVNREETLVSVRDFARNGQPCDVWKLFVNHPKIYFSSKLESFIFFVFIVKVKVRR